jgi:hypothetical protein
MTTDRHLERDLPAILGEIAMGRYPEYIDDVLATTAQRRQRPGWTFLERWLPVELVTTRVPVTRMPWRQIGILALLVLLIAAAVIGYIGTQQPRLPAPFGPAGNGLIAYSTAGDIYTADPVTGVATAIVTGPEADIDPIWSRDGTRVAFHRKMEGVEGPGLLFVAPADGSELALVTPDPINSLAAWSFSPDGRSIVATAQVAGLPAILVMPSDGAGNPRVLQIEKMVLVEAPAYRPPSGDEIMFVGRRFPNPYRALYAIGPSSGDVRTIVEPSVDFDVYGATWSPDGSRIAYGSCRTSATQVSSRIHIIGAGGTGDRLVDNQPNTIADGGTMVWSNDGTRLIITRVFAPAGERSAAVVVRVDGGPAVEIDCPVAATADGCPYEWEWAPDDRSVLGFVTGLDANAPPVLVDPFTGNTHPAPWAATGMTSWQRVAR